MELDTQRIDDAVLALLLLGLHDGDRVWKSFDWYALGRLHEQGHSQTPWAAPSPWCSLRRASPKRRRCCRRCSANSHECPL